MSTYQRGLLIAFVATLIWATTPIFIGYLFQHYPIQPLALSFWRAFGMGVALLLFFAVRRPSALRLTRTQLQFLIIYGGIVIALMNTLWTYSVQLNGAAVATVLVYSSPSFTVLLAHFWLREKLTWRKLFAVGLSLVGCIFVVKAYTPELWQGTGWNLGLGLISGVAMALYNIAGRSSTKLFSNSWIVTGYGFAFTALVLMFLQPPSAIFSLGQHWDGWLILAILTLGPSLFGFGLYNLSLHYLAAGTSSLVASLEPFFTALMAIFFLNEILEPIQWFGALLTILAIVLIPLSAD